MLFCLSKTANFRMVLSMKYQTILFDLDGTLMDTSQGIFNTANQTLQSLGLEPFAHDQLRGFVGPPLADCFRYACQVEESLIPSAVELYRHYYKETGWSQAIIYPGMLEILELLSSKKARLAVATLKLEIEALKIINHFGLAPYFETVSGSLLHQNLSKADTIITALKRIDCQDLSTVVMIGDTEHDYQGALSVGVDFIAVDYGFGFQKGHQDSSSPRWSATISSPSELAEVLTLR